MLNFCTRFLPNTRKEFRDFFILFRFWVIWTYENKTWFRNTHKNEVFTFLLLNQDLNKAKTNPEYPFVDIVIEEICEKFQQKVLNLW